MSALVADVAEAEEFLAKNPDIDTIQIAFTNQSGVARGKNLRRHDLLPIYQHARYLPGTMLALDITGEDVDESGLVWANGDADYLGKPIPGTLVRAPWLGPTFAQVLLSVYELDGSPCAYDPRHVLRRVIERFKEFDLTPVVACELEFFLVEHERGPNGELRVPASPVTGNRPWDIQAYGLRELDDFDPFFRDLYAACGFEVEGILREFFYLDGRYVDDVLMARTLTDAGSRAST